MSVDIVMIDDDDKTTEVSYDNAAKRLTTHFPVKQMLYRDEQKKRVKSFIESGLSRIASEENKCASTAQFISGAPGQGKTLLVMEIVN